VGEALAYGTDNNPAALLALCTAAVSRPVIGEYGLSLTPSSLVLPAAGWVYSSARRRCRRVDPRDANKFYNVDTARFTAPRTAARNFQDCVANLRPPSGICERSSSCRIMVVMRLFRRWAGQFLERRGRRCTWRRRMR